MRAPVLFLFEDVDRGRSPFDGAVVLDVGPAEEHRVADGVIGRDAQGFAPALPQPDEAYAEAVAAFARPEFDAFGKLIASTCCWLLTHLFASMMLIQSVRGPVRL